MRPCFIAVWACLAGAAGLAAADPPGAVHHVTSVVRTDARSGRLVRTVVVSPRVVRASEVKPRAPGAAPETSAAPGSTRVEEFVEQTAQRFEVDPLLIHSVIQVESNYNPFAVSPKGAEGLMQLMPQTARRFAVKNSFNPWENIEGGVRYLSYLLDLFRGDRRLALAAYNAGEGAVFKYGGIPPYAETTQYLYRVGKKLGEARRAAEARAARNKQAAGSGAAPIEAFEDSQGRLHIQTRSAP